MSYESNYIDIDLQAYDHLFAMDWSFLSDTEVTHKGRKRDKLTSQRIKSDIKSMLEYYGQFKGKKLLVYEESTGAHWLYVELKAVIDRIVICDPYHNSLLKEGPKTDKIDSFKLMHLLLNHSLKEVYHSASDLYALRCFMSGYEDLSKAMVRLKNQIAGIKRATGYKKNAKDYKAKEMLESFVYEQKQSRLELLESQMALYKKQMSKLISKDKTLKNLTRLSGIGPVIALTIYSRVIDAQRFSNKYKYYGYCGLAKHPHESGKTIRGQRRGRYNPRMKWAYKSAALAAIKGRNDIHDYYMFLLGKGYSEATARNEIARYLARVSLAIIKNKSKYIPYNWSTHVA